MLQTESVHSQFGGLDRSFAGISGTAQRDIRDVTCSGNYNITPELSRGINTINTGLNNIRLDHDFLSSSREWGKKWSPVTVNQDKQGAIQAAGNAASAIQNVRSKMSSGQVQSLQENQIRANNQQAMTQISTAQRDMEPYAYQSVNRIRQFCDHIGVTDRYTGYRNNMNRGSRDPVRLGFKWMDNQQQNSYNNTLNVGWRPGGTVPTGRSYDSRQTMSAPVTAPSKTFQPVTRRSIQEQCGINTKFPGTTEYTDRFDKPPMDQATPGYIVNPIPDFRMKGRELGQPKFARSHTEYQNRFEYPDGSKLVKLPWLRQ